MHPVLEVEQAFGKPCLVHSSGGTCSTARLAAPSAFRARVGHLSCLLALQEVQLVLGELATGVARGGRVGCACWRNWSHKKPAG